MEAKHAAFVDIFFWFFLNVSVDTKTTIHTDESVEAVGEKTMVA